MRVTPPNTRRCQDSAVTTTIVKRLLLYVHSVLLIGVPFAQSTVGLQSPHPVLTVKHVAVDSIDLAKRTLGLKVSVNIENPAPAFTLKELRYTVKLNDEDAAEGKYDKEVRVPGGSKFDLELPLTVKLSSLPSVSWNAVTEGFKLKYRLHTEATIPLFSSISHKLKNDSVGELALDDALAKWYARIKDRIATKP